MEENKRERWKKAVLPEEDTKMGFYLNSRAPYVLYEGETKSRYFIDKTLMLEKIFGFIEEEVDGLYEKYLADTVNPKIGRDDLKHHKDEDKRPGDDDYTFENAIESVLTEFHLSREQIRYLKPIVMGGQVKSKVWYDGYYTKSGERIYNPRSVVLALSNNNLGNYWTNSGPYDEI